MNHKNEDLVDRYLAGLEGHAREGSAERKARFRQALTRMENDPAEAARIDAIAVGAGLDDLSSAQHAATDVVSEGLPLRGHEGKRRLGRNGPGPQPPTSARWRAARPLAWGFLLAGLVVQTTLLAVWGAGSASLVLAVALGAVAFSAIVTPVVGFTINQVSLSRKGRKLAATVEEIRLLKSSDAATFAHAMLWAPRDAFRLAENVAGPPPAPADPGEADRFTRPHRPSRPPSMSGEFCSIVMTDIVGFESRVRSDDDRRIAREAMYRILQEAFSKAGLRLADYYQEDRGDGALIIIPPDIPPRAVADPLIAYLGVQLRRHNRSASEAFRIQLRAALHVGPVTWDSQGVTGHALLQAARLLQAPILKRQLAETGADLGLIASTLMYESVIRESPGFIDPSRYHRVQVQIKESNLIAWLCLTEGDSLRALSSAT